MAPGVDILSTIPGDGYAMGRYIDGSPVAAGMALVRTRFSDKAVYSSRFIMGQVASTGSGKQGITPCQNCLPKAYLSADSLKALTEVPSPSLSYLEHYLFDDIEQEIPMTAMALLMGSYRTGTVIKLLGMADNVDVTLEAQAEGAIGPDHYVSFDIPTVNYGAVGSFNEDDNGLIYDDGQLITGVNTPSDLRAVDTPNEHIIPFKVTMTAIMAST